MKVNLYTADLEYVFHNDTIIFNGSYSVGDSECVAMDVSVPDDNLVEGTEKIEATSNDIFITIYIIVSLMSDSV